MPTKRQIAGIVPGWMNRELTRPLIRTRQF
jgi:hypothetical protein